MKKPRFVLFQKQFHWTIMDTYILKKFLGSVFYSIALLMTIIIVFDISENVQRFLDHNVPVKLIIFQYYFNFIPYFINLFFPLFTFISVIWFTSKLSGNNEVISFFNGGVSFYRFLVPYMIGALILCVLSMVFANFIIPDTNVRLNKFREENMYRKRYITNSNIHFKSAPNTYVYAERWRKQDAGADNLTVEVLGKDKVTYKLHADWAKYNDTTHCWQLYTYRIRYFDETGEHVELGERLDTAFNFLPEDFNDDVKVAETLGYRSLKKFIQKEKEKGSSLVKSYQIEQQKRMANPFSIIIMTLLGLSVAARKSRRGVGVHIFVGLFFVFTFILFQQISNVFAVAEQLSPAMATWLPNILYFFISLVLIYYTPK